MLHDETPHEAPREEPREESIETAPRLRTYSPDALYRCGCNWGTDVDLTGRGVIKRSTGDASWMEAAVDGVIGMHGNQPGKGPGVIIKDVATSGIDMLWTGGLTGCMGLAIIGVDDEGKIDVFFGHARHYDKADATTDPENPMSLAKEFVQTHRNVRVFWGTDFNFGNSQLFEGQAKRAEAQRVLSKQLGCWVRDSDCVVSRDLVFLPQFGLMKDGTPKQVYDWASTTDLQPLMKFSKSKALSRFVPDPKILKDLEDHLAAIQSDRNSWIRFYPHDSRRSNKIMILEHIIDAYKVGNFDLLRRFAESAERSDTPYADESTKNMWAAWGKSVTAKLAKDAYDDVLQKTLQMGSHGCGLKPDGNYIYSAKEYAERAAREHAAIHVPVP